MRITRSEHDIIFIPETKWEYDQLYHLLTHPVKVVGFDNPWETQWENQGGLKIKIPEPYE